MTAINTSASTAPTTQSSTQSTIASGQQTLTTNYNTFLQLLTTQLTNQDPTSPLDTNAFTQQLVQMTGVQQQLLSNQLLQQLVNAQSGGVANSVGLIGKNVTAQSSNSTLSGGQASWAYNLGGAAGAATATISNSIGQVIWTGAVPDLSAGQHTVAWTGHDSSGLQLPDGGTYTLQIAATDSTGAAMNPSILLQGVATAVSQANGQSSVSIGANKIPLSSITQVSAQ